MFIERLLRLRTIRVIAAAALIVAGLWAFAPYFFYNVAPSAFINAGLKRITAPIAGKLSDSLPAKGDFLVKNSLVPLIDARSPDRTRLLDLQRQALLAKGSGQLAQKQLAEIADLDESLRKRVDAYYSATLIQLERQIAETAALQAGCANELVELRDVSGRMKMLTQKGLASQIRHSTSLAKEAETATRCSVANAHFLKLQAELDAAQKGVYLRDGMNDVPYSQQQRDQLLLRRQLLQRELQDAQLQATELTAAVGAEELRISRATSYRLPLPEGHVVWSMEASPGSAVTEGQTILHLADCKTRFLAVELRERDFEQIIIGDAASVRLIGDEAWHEGWVQNVQGSAARNEDQLFAANRPDAGPGKITVELRLSPDAFPATGSTYCGIGRLAEVRFQRKPLAFVSAIGEAMKNLAEWFGGEPRAELAADS